ncbi:hypothetical protein ACGFMM_31540 [Streptomyces sp. NPDC048604]|uniref:hypothetical protein n=1 Tax=Streptomyces sp. NPDC048604 TaxID=3365578 RepID=UPI00371499FD
MGRVRSLGPLRAGRVRGRPEARRHREAKSEHRAPQPVAEAPEPAGHVVDLTAALEQSVQAARERRGETTGDATVHEMPAPRKKVTAKKASSKKSAGKKTTPKKATWKRSA